MVKQEFIQDRIEKIIRAISEIHGLGVDVTNLKIEAIKLMEKINNAKGKVHE